ALRPERGGPLQPFQVMFSFLNETPPAPTVAGVTWSVGPMVDNGTSKFDLTLFLDDSPSSRHGTFEYSTDLFEPATVARMAGHLRTLLEGIAADPDRRLSALPLLPAAEWDQVLHRWN